MPLSDSDLKRFLTSVHPYDSLSPERLAALVPAFRQIEADAGTSIYRFGDALDGLYLVHAGEVEVTDENGMPVSLLGPRNSFGERGLARDGRAATSARATCASHLLMLPRADFDALKTAEPVVARFFNRTRPTPAAAARGPGAMAATRAADMMASPPVTCPPEMTCQKAAQLMQTRGISCLCVTDDGALTGELTGILTTRDLTGKLLAEGLPHATPVAEVMTRDPQVLPPAALGADILRLMSEHGFGHVPIVEAGRLIGIVTQTDLTRFQAVSQAWLLSAIARARSAEEIARATAEIPRLLVQLVAGGTRHEITTRLITDIADSATRRLLALAEERLGTPPVPYLWLACGSQGRQEQTGVSDQDNCLILSDDYTPGHADYFEALARLVCDGLNTCGYVYCPGEMMAVNPRWRQPLATWRGYFKGWIESPGPEAQMLASVMFDLRPIGGQTLLFTGLQAEVLEAASANSIFTAHMTANSLKHTPPLGLFRGLATIRSGEHRNTLDLKHNGVVPVADLARLYALQGKLAEVGTRARLTSAAAAGVLSASGARDLTDAYDLIAQTRLEHQASQIRNGAAPDNYLAPADLSDFERSHLRNAFVVVKTMQSAAGHGKSVLS
ncbi:DUF294 nucleotidyltransferase-like domain-containing protein [Cribrihabitans neustonicus]|uniref:DUF294 nucleotidyltransferase-like domain-containing protein n=1 Tax=Cribrihabitans neustonicus TaxID=1429085 RepID=UPI003B5944CC